MPTFFSGLDPNKFQSYLDLMDRLMRSDLNLQSIKFPRGLKCLLNNENNDLNFSFEDIPKLVVGGIQSAGKTSWLSTHCGFRLGYTHADTANRCPVLYRMKRALTRVDPVARVRSKEGNTVREAEEIPCDQLFNRIGDHMRMIGNTAQRFSKTPLEVTIEGPNVHDIVILDLVGLIPNDVQNPESAPLIKEIAATYLRDPSYEVVIVAKSTESLSTSADFALLNEIFCSETISCPFKPRTNWKLDSIKIINKVNLQFTSVHDTEGAQKLFDTSVAAHGDMANLYFTALVPDNRDLSRLSFQEYSNYVKELPELERRIFSEFFNQHDCPELIDDPHIGITKANEAIQARWSRAIDRSFKDYQDRLHRFIRHCEEIQHELEEMRSYVNIDHLRDKYRELILDFHKHILKFQNMERFDQDEEIMRILPELQYSPQDYGTTFEEDVQEADRKAISDQPPWKFLDKFQELCQDPDSSDVAFVKDASLHLLGMVAYRRLVKHFIFLVISNNMKDYEMSYIRSIGETQNDGDGLISYSKAVLGLAKNQISEAGKGFRWFGKVLQTMCLKYCHQVLDVLLSDQGKYATLGNIRRKNFVHDMVLVFQEYFSELLTDVERRWREDIENYSSRIPLDLTTRMNLCVLITPWENTMKSNQYYRTTTNGRNSADEVGTGSDLGTEGEAGGDNQEDNVSFTDEKEPSSPIPIMKQKSLLSRMKKAIRKRFGFESGDRSTAAASALSFASSKEGYQIPARIENMNNHLQEFRNVAKTYGQPITPAEYANGGYASLGEALAGAIDYEYIKSAAYEYYICAAHILLINFETCFENFFVQRMIKDPDNILRDKLEGLLNSKKEYGVDSPYLVNCTGLDIQEINEAIRDVQMKMEEAVQMQEILHRTF